MTKKLTELRPRWVGLHNWSSESKFYIGLTFDSPVTGNRLAVLFSPPIDPDGLQAKYGWPEPFLDQRHWQRTGDTFETLSLRPSVDFSKYGDWHGSIELQDGVAVAS